MYRIIESTDNRFIGNEIVISKQHIELGDFVFNIVDRLYIGDIVIVSNANYVLILKEI